jgi:AAHS family 4-hydroxybenzoate transporter-like MFS transporter
MSGSSAGIIAIASSIYPVSSRATGVGWALGVGRIGSIVGPSLGAVLIAAGMDARTIFMLMIVPTMVAVLTLAVLQLRSRRALRVEQSSTTSVFTPVES